MSKKILIDASQPTETRIALINNDKLEAFELEVFDLLGNRVKRIENISSVEPLEIIEVQTGDYLGEDDIVRFEDIYGRINS